MFRQILVPLDGSPQAELALPFAVGIAAKSGGTIHIVLVHEPEAYSEYAGAHLEDFELEGKSQETVYLNTVREKLSAEFDGKLEVHHLEGVVAETLTAEVIQRGIDLVVMNSHGWGYTSRALLGSVSDYLLQHLHVPLLLMHSQAGGGPLNRAVSFRRVLVPLDGSELAAAVLAPAQALAALWDGELRLVRVVSPPGQFGGLGGLIGAEAAAGAAALQKAKDDAQRELDSVAGGLRDAKHAASTQVLVHRKVAAAIQNEALAAECDLIAISTHGRGGLSRLLVGSVADKVVRGAEVPVLVYQPKRD